MLQGDVSQKFQIPIEHFDYGYIEKCNDIRELVKILKVLRSGDEGCYPDLERFCENRIEALDPQNRILRKEVPVKTKYDLPPDEWQNIAAELSQWLEEVREPVDENGGEDADEDLPRSFRKKVQEARIHHQHQDDADDESCNENLPPIRGTNVHVAAKVEAKAPPADSAVKKEEEVKPKPALSAKPETKQAKKKKKPMPRSYREWDKIDVESELKKVDEEEQNKPSKPAAAAEPAKPQAATDAPKGIQLGEINKASLSETEIALKAEREKEKGNEAFRAGDYEEALAYYNRSLSLQMTMAVLNNRAFTYLKLEKWDHAIKDCNTVLAEDPKNIKALFRRASAYKSRKQFVPAKKDLEKVLSIDSSHQKAVELLEAVKKSIEATKKEGNRLVIEEVSDEEEDEQVQVENKPIAEKIAPPNEERTHFGHTDLSRHDVTKKASKPTRVSEEKPAPKNHAKSTTTPPTVNTNSKSIWENAEIEVEQEKQRVGTRIKIDEVKEEKLIEKAADPPKIFKEKSMGELLDYLTTLKDRAGKLFSSGQYDDALKLYDEAIGQTSFQSALLSFDLKTVQANNLRYTYGLLLTNAAACYLKLTCFEKCIERSSESLKFIPRFAKSHLRKAAALEALERFEEALQDYAEVLTIEPSSKPAAEGKQRCENKLEELKRSKKESLGTRLLIEDESDEEDVDEISKPIESPKGQKSADDSPRIAKPLVIDVPKLAAGAGPFEFAQVWATMVKTGQQMIQQNQNAEDEDDAAEPQSFEMFAPFWEFLEQIPIAQMSKVFSNQLDGTSFSMIINCLYFAIVFKETVSSSDNQFAANCLLQLASIQRFTVAAMFLTDRQKLRLRDVVKTLVAACDDDSLKQSLKRQFASYL